VVKILTVLGARPQFIKAATVSRAIRARDDIHEVIVHTGQHFDANMSDVFFDQLDIPKPNYNLGIASLGHGAMTGRMLEKIEQIIQEEKPDWVLVYGDTNSSLAGALAAAKLHTPVAHVEAGLRSFNPFMPEEINRIQTDRVSALLLCPTKTAVENLLKEGFPFKAPVKVAQDAKASSTGDVALQRIENVGDVMYDAVLFYKELAQESVSLDSFGLRHKGYALCTIHRQENTDYPENLTGIFKALREINRDLPVVLPIHPRTRTKLSQLSGDVLQGLKVIEPLPYLEIQRLLMSAKVVLTDSGGMQKEAYFHEVPCITLRNETEWMETVEASWNHLVGPDTERILAAQTASSLPRRGVRGKPYGDGTAAQKLVEIIAS
jgi:UDP-GlcNAc3NAcA epimerase